MKNVKKYLATRTCSACGLKRKGWTDIAPGLTQLSCIPCGGVVAHRVAPVDGNNGNHKSHVQGLADSVKHLTRMMLPTPDKMLLSKPKGRIAF